ncbi:MAG: ImmA/IrrE family metallo-endopeptidase [Gammaproteobacteria bacterium]|nr:ImmA/IrrE family metallo-endopeptidase [Gammaproteobacteria bacterium]
MAEPDIPARFESSDRVSPARFRAWRIADPSIVSITPRYPIAHRCRKANPSREGWATPGNQARFLLRIERRRAGRGPAVVVNTWDRISVERWIFTAAHEFGHLLLHPDENRRDATELPVQAEREADVFASEFLMPETAFATEWEETQQGTERRHLRGEIAFLEPQVEIPLAPGVIVESGEQQPPLPPVRH